jgi:hypothetical protein
MHQQLLDWLQRYQIENKRAPKDSEVRQHIDDMLIQGRTEQQGWFARNVGTLGSDRQGAATTPHAKFLFTVPQADLEKFYVPYAQIPADKRGQVEQALSGQTQGLSDAQKQKLIEDTYLKALVIQRRR